MPEMKREWDVLSDEQRRFLTDEIIGYFEMNRGEKIGIVAAGQLLDFFLRTAGRSVYNRALDDTKVFLEKSFGSVLLDIDVTLRKSGDT